MAIIVRLLMVILAYVLACIAASVVLTIGTLTPQWNQIAPQGMPSIALWSVIGVGTAVIGVIAMLPAFLVIALAEGFAWRSIVLYGALGGVLALALTYGGDFAVISAALTAPRCTSRKCSPLPVSPADWCIGCLPAAGQGRGRA